MAACSDRLIERKKNIARRFAQEAMGARPVLCKFHVNAQSELSEKHASLILVFQFISSRILLLGQLTTNMSYFPQMVSHQQFVTEVSGVGGCRYYPIIDVSSAGDAESCWFTISFGPTPNPQHAAAWNVPTAPLWTVNINDSFEIVSWEKH